MWEVLKISLREREKERCHSRTYLNTRDNQLTTLPLFYISQLLHWTLYRSS